MTVTFEAAKELLAPSTRNELRDHAFGDKEVYFEVDGTTIAEGYSGSSGQSVHINGTEFTGEEACILLALGTLGNVDRNDSGKDDDEPYDGDDDFFPDED